MLILDLWGISFHPVVVFDLGKKLLFKSVLGNCGRFFSEFVSRANNSKIYQPNEIPQKTKSVALEFLDLSFWINPSSNPTAFELERSYMPTSEAFSTLHWTNSVIVQLSIEKISGLTKFFFPLIV